MRDFLGIALKDVLTLPSITYKGEAPSEVRVTYLRLKDWETRSGLLGRNQSHYRMFA